MNHVRALSKKQIPGLAVCEGPTIKGCIGDLLEGAPPDAVLFGCIPAAIQRKKCEAGAP